jgi:hypothetical protein
MFGMAAFPTPAHLDAPGAAVMPSVDGLRR